MKIALVSTWLPKPCGIATFSRDLAAAWSAAEPRTEWRVAAINDPGDAFQYPAVVRQQIDKEELGSLRRVAAWINASGADVVSLQHEFGLWGGFDGEFLLRFLDRLRVPVVVTLHTTPLVESTYDQANRLRLIGELERRVARVVVFLPEVADFLASQVGLARDRIAVIPHGAPRYDHLDRATTRAALALDDRLVICTFGLLNRHKGIADVLAALPPLVAAHPNLLYVVLGRPHPLEPPSFYADLQHASHDLGLDRHVRFEPRFIPEPELDQWLVATDIYVTPYRDLAQISSGTLTYALSAGCCCVATPYLYARSLLAEGRGVLTPVAEPETLTATLAPLLADCALRERYGRAAKAYGEQLAWPMIGRRYLDTFAAAGAVR